MTSTPPRDEPVFRSGGDGRAAALIAWVLYILSIPSANLLVLVGLVVAYASRSSATGLALAHIDAQIRLFWSVFWWSVVAIVGILASIPLVFIGIGFITIIVFGLMWLVVSIWFTVKSVIGLFNLLGDRAP